MFHADLHMHSTFSDGKMTIPELVNFYGEKGFGAISITDHLCETNTLWGKVAHSLKLTLDESTFPLYMAILKSESKRAWEKYHMVVIPGFEITKNPLSDRKAAHILALGVTDYISANDSVRTVLAKIRSYGGISVAAHPRPIPNIRKQTLYLWDHRAELTAEIDAWEVANGRTFFDDVANSSLPKLASSDMHDETEYESWKTTLFCERNTQAIFAAIRLQALSFKYFSDQEVRKNDFDRPHMPVHVGRPFRPRRDRDSLLAPAL